MTAGQGLELESIAAAVVGGVSTLGGSGTIVGSFLGAVLIGLLDQSLVRVPEISEFVRDAVLGLLILLAVVLDGLLSRRFVSRRTIMRPTAGTAVAGDADAAGARGADGDRSAPAAPVNRRSRRPTCAPAQSVGGLLLVILVGTIVFNVTQSNNYLGVAQPGEPVPAGDREGHRRA